MIEFKIEYLPAINFSLVNNKIVICHSIEIGNTSNEDLSDVVIECSGDFFIPTRSNIIDLIKKDKSIRPEGLDLKPDPTKVSYITEKILTTFNVKISAVVNGSCSVVFSKDYPIDIMPYDQWLGTSILPKCLASFVIPNHPAINNIIVKAAQILKSLSKSSAFTEYQTDNTNEVRKQVAAVYGALHAENIIYRSMPASYENIGQRITLPHQVLASKTGNCIELTLLFASILESIGINSGIIIQKGHAYLAVWLVNDCCQYSVCDDASYIEKKSANGIDEMLVIECTQITSENTSFEEAQRIAEKHLANLEMFEMFIDIRRCRLENIYPLPLTDNNGTWELDTNGVEHDRCILNVRKHSRYDLSKILENKHDLTKIDLWERKLLDFSLRNSMLNLYLRKKAIQFISFEVNLIEDYLQDGNEYLITSKPEVNFRIPDEERLIRSKLIPELHTLITNDIKHKVLHSYKTEQDTRDTLKNIYRTSRNAIEETGANALYLAIGTLRWFETDVSEKAHYAPILMLPVEMIFKKGNYYIRRRDEEIVLNITLIEFLRQNFSINIPGLNTLPRDKHGVDVSMIFAIFRDALKNQKRWDIEEESILGVFSFNKFLMWNDIHNHRTELLENDIVRSLTEQRLIFSPADIVSDLKETDKNMPPDNLALPVSADSSQMAAVIEAGLGHSFILYGPPGTGKSQTITNLIANALFQGKRILFVAEKMAALSVVQKRLERIGLAPFCLEIHSNKISKRHVLEQLEKALNVTHIVNPKDFSRMAEELYGQRKKLIEYMEAIHDTRGNDGLSVYDCIVRFESIDAPKLNIDTSDRMLRKKFSIDKLDYYRYLLSEKFNAIVNIVGRPPEHPLSGLNVSEDDLADAALFSSKLKDSISIIQAGYDNRKKLSSAFSIRKEITRDCDDTIFEENPDTLYKEWKTIRAKWIFPRIFAQKKFIKALRRFNPLITGKDVDTLLAKLIDYKNLHDEITEINNVITNYFAYKCHADILPPNRVLDRLIYKLSIWTEHQDKLRDWYQWCAYKKELCDSGLEVVANKIEKSFIPKDTLCDSFLKSMFKSLAEEKISKSSILRTFEGAIFDETVSRFQKLAEEFQALSQKELYARLAARIPHITDNIDNSSEIGLLRRNISNGGRGLSLRDLIAQIPTLLPHLCPCMLMSPMSVARFLDISNQKFDIVVFDEASQMPTSDAVGAIARGKSVIVVGDPKQMPPTSFFSSTSVSEDEADLDDMESILEDCRTLDLPSLQLNWHYRSRHESLIAFSNNEYYGGSLITFPSVDDRNTKVKYNYVDGIYEKGSQRSNRKEAEAIVKKIAGLLAMPDSANNSIGVIAFSISQQNLIEDLLMEMLEKNKKLMDAASNIYEPIFVKNLENVQGDERDIIIFSIGYGPDKYGKVSMNFGPLNNSGGERRLNVAVSRARKEMLVFSALKSSQIDLRRSKSKGVEGLKHFLEYAEHQVLIGTEYTETYTEDSIIANQIAAALRDMGYVADTNIGRSSFKVNVAISADKGKGKGNYSLGILLDGKGYHNTQTTRDREIVQPSVLRNLNWNIMRVWSVDWINNPKRVLARIEKRLKETPITDIPKTKTVFDISNETIEKATSKQSEYKSFTPGVEDLRFMKYNNLATEILKIEQPMTLDYLSKKLCFYKKHNLNNAMQTKIQDMVNKYMFVQTIGSEITVWTDRESAESFTGYRKSDIRDITNIPSIEIMNAIIETLEEQFSIKKDALTLIVARKLGFMRRSKKIEQALSFAIEQLAANNKIIETEDKLRIVESN